MASIKEINEVEEFTSGPLFKWFTTCMELIDPKINNLTYKTLIDGIHIRRLLCETGIPMIDKRIEHPLDQNKRYLNFKSIMNNIRNFYEKDQVFVILREPNIERLIEKPKLNVLEMKILFHLLITCTKCGPNSEKFLIAWKTLGWNDLTDISSRIRELDPSSEFVLCHKMFHDHNYQSRVMDSVSKMKAELNSYREMELLKNLTSEEEKTKAEICSQIEEEQFYLEKVEDFKNQIESASKNLKSCKRACRKSMKEVADSKKLINTELANLKKKKEYIDEMLEKLRNPEAEICTIL